MSQQQERLRRSKPEVLAPAGNLRSVQAAIDFGADAVYCGGKAFGMRSAPKNLSLEDFQAAARYAHARGARIYVTCNILPRNDEITDMISYIGDLSQTGIDALIVTDIGVLMMAKRVAPRLELHVSTQAGVTNYQAAQVLYDLGAQRVVLARELDLQAVRDIRANIPNDMDIECFVHGSMCMAFSGRCLISNYMTGRDGNHGECAQPCRWKYHVVEEKRPGEYFPVEETKDGTFIFNSQDMNMLEHIDDVLDAGATSLKIEGRAKSTYYVAAMANAYACAVDEYMVQRGFEDEHHRTLQPFHDLVKRSTTPSKPLLGEDNHLPASQRLQLPEWLVEEPYKVAHREYSTGFYYPENQVTQNLDRGGYCRDWLVVGEVESYDAAEKRMHMFSRNKIEPGQMIEFLIPRHEPVQYEVPADGLLDEQGLPVSAINNPAHRFSLPCPFEIAPNSMIRAKSQRRTLKASMST